MSDQLKALYAVQQVDSKLEHAKKESAALDRGDKLKAQLAAADVQKGKLADELRKAEADLQDAELQLKSIEQKKATYEKKLYGGGASAKELAGMEKEVEMLSHNRAQLDERILAMYETVDQKRAALREYEGRIEAAQQRLRKIVETYTAESARIAVETRRLESERAKVAEGIETPLLRRYDSIRARAEGVGITRVADGKCGGCHIALTTFMVRKIFEDSEPTFCENCGRFLLRGDG
jgi:uncharacterized protein